jgi:hypothetical protein
MLRRDFADRVDVELPSINAMMSATPQHTQRSAQTRRPTVQIYR